MTDRPGGTDGEDGTGEAVADSGPRGGTGDDATGGGRSTGGSDRTDGNGRIDRWPPSSRRSPLRWDRWGLRVVAGATALLLVAVFYYPVGVVLVEAVLVGGRLTASGIAAILSDPFYFGALAELFADPLAVGRHLRTVADWLAGAVRPLDPRFYAGVVLAVLTFPLSTGEYVPAVRALGGLFGFTVYQAALSTVASVAVGLPGAYVLARFEFPGRRTVRSLTILPFVLPGIMVATGFLAFFGRRGTLNGLLGTVGLGPVELVGTLEVVILAHAFYNAPLVARITTAAWEGADRRAVETARALGAGPRRAFRDVVLPQLVPAIATGALLTFLFTFMTFPIVLALGGLELATVEVWVFDRIRRLAITEAAGLAVLETVLTLGLTYAYLRYERRVTAGGIGGGGAGAGGAGAVADGGADGSGESGDAAGASGDRERLVPATPRALLAPRRLALAAYGLVVLVLFVGPMAGMVVESVTVGDRLTARHWQFLLDRQVEGTPAQTKPVPAVVNSLLFAAGTLLLAVPMGVAVAAVTARRDDSRAGSALEALALAPLAVSGVVLGVGLLRGLVFGVPVPGLPYRIQATGPLAVVAAHAVAAYPFVVRNVAPRLATVDRETVESARALGATRTRALVDVELPMVATGVLAGAALAVAISFGEFDSTVLLAQGTDSYTMPVAVERYLGRLRGPAFAMGTVLLAVTGLAFLVVDRLGGRAGGPG